MTARPRQLIITVRRERGRILVERPGAPPWQFDRNNIAGALALARTAVKLFGARLVVELTEEAQP